MTATLLLEGTSSRSSQQISEKMEFLGTQLSSNADCIWLAKGENIELNSEPPRQLAIGRDERFRPLFTELDSDTFAVLITLANEPRLAVASEQLAEQGDAATVPQRIAQSLHHALARGWVATIELTAI